MPPIGPAVANAFYQATKRRIRALPLELVTKYPGVLHALCNAHHLRELKALVEIEKEDWARKMQRLLRRACHAANLARERGARSQSSWLVAGIVPGVERQPLKKLAIDERALLNLLSRWRAEAEKKGHRITRIAVAFEADTRLLAGALARCAGRRAPRH